MFEYNTTPGIPPCFIYSVLYRLNVSQEKKDRWESSKILGRIEKIAISKLVEKRKKTAENLLKDFMPRIVNPSQPC